MLEKVKQTTFKVNKIKGGSAIVQWLNNLPCTHQDPIRAPVRIPAVPVPWERSTGGFVAWEGSKRWPKALGPGIHLGKPEEAPGS